MFEFSSLLGIGIFVGILFVSIAFHETMHAYVAYKLGDDLAHSRGRINLNPLKHIDPILTIGLPVFMLLLGLPPILAAKPVPINPNRVSGEELGMAAVGFAGPFTNLVLATIGSVVLHALSLPVGVASDILRLFVQLNVALFVFNMLPLPPLDGSRVLYAVAPAPVQELMDRLERMGLSITLLMLFLLLPVLSPILVAGNNYILSILLP
ncbi:site-2 protease family protein [Candidatus Saccharibacteria bacterium]|nr:site-2 protease family protein [Candidatus Saccharibacteria bacterium]